MTLTHATPKLWTREAYEKLWESGALEPDNRTELIEGAIVEMSPQNSPHSRHLTTLNMMMVTRFAATHLVRVQMPLNLGTRSQPEPDLALVARSEPRDGHPELADLIVEVAASSLAYDRLEKASLYARWQQPELWIVLVDSGRLEVCRDPQPDSLAPFGWSYATRFQLGPGAEIAPLCTPAVTLDVGELLTPS